MKYFVKCQMNGGDSYMSFDGQTEEQINHGLGLMGATDIVFIPEEEFRTATQPQNQGDSQ